MKHIGIICAALALLAIFSTTAIAQDQTPGTVLDMDEIMQLYYGTDTMPAEGIGANPTIHELRSYYNVSGYSKEPYDKYSPGWTAVMSAVVPGLGQIACGKAVRGIIFLLGTAAPVTAAVLTYQKPYFNDFGFPEHNIGHTVALIGASVVMWAWNVIDAAEVAILLDKYNRDLLRNKKAELSVEPSLSMIPSACGSVIPAAGITLAINF